MYAFIYFRYANDTFKGRDYSRKNNLGGRRLEVWGGGGIDESII